MPEEVNGSEIEPRGDNYFVDDDLFNSFLVAKLSGQYVHYTRAYEKEELNYEQASDAPLAALTPLPKVRMLATADATAFLVLLRQLHS